MDTKNIKQWIILPCPSETAYHAWMDSKQHGDMVEGKAKIDPVVGGEYSIWNNDIVGTTLELDPVKYRIVQSWRYNYDDWPKDQFSKIIIEFTPYKDNQTKVRFWHSDIPAKYADEISKGWKKYYWTPMEKYFKELQS